MAKKKKAEEARQGFFNIEDSVFDSLTSKVKEPGNCRMKDGSQDKVTVLLIFLGAPLGYAAITPQNWREVANRFKIWQAAIGCFMRRPDGCPIPINETDIENHIGLVTQGTSTSRSEYLKRLRNAAEGVQNFDQKHGALLAFVKRTATDLTEKLKKKKVDLAEVGFIVNSLRAVGEGIDPDNI